MPGGCCCNRLRIQAQKIVLVYIDPLPVPLISLGKSDAAIGMFCWDGWGLKSSLHTTRPVKDTCGGEGGITQEGGMLL